MNQPARQQTYSHHSSEAGAPELPVGEILRRTRVHYKRSIEDVEGALRIQAKQIEAIETGNTEALPARVYAIGFVRSYAEYLGLDSEKIIELFKNQSEAGTAEPDLHFPEASEDASTPPIKAIVIGLFVLLAGIGIFSLLGSSGSEDTAKPEVEVVPEVPTELKAEVLEETQGTVAAVEPETQPEPEPVAQQPEPVQPQGIILKMISDSWVEIRDQNRRKLISRVLKAGDQYFVPDREGLSISIGNAGGVEILVNGEALQNIGVSGQVIRNIPLNANTLKQRFAPIDDNGTNAENLIEN
jgi:cytoskeleton protein RodZ